MVGVLERLQDPDYKKEKVSNMNFFVPYVITVYGVVSDLVTTQIGLSKSFIETQSIYSPFIALTVLIGVMAIFDLFFRNARYKMQFQLILVSVSFLGAINNVLVLLRVFGGLML